MNSMYYRENQIEQLHQAIEQGNLSKVQHLKDEGASVNTYLDGYSPIARAISAEQPEIAKTLLDFKADPHQGCRVFGGRGKDRHKPPIIMAVHHGYCSLVEQLLDLGADINAADDLTNECALHIAVANNNAEILKVLLKNGINVNRVDYSSHSALHVAVQQSNENMARLLIDGGATVNTAGNNDQLPLHLASLSGNTEMVKLLLEYGSMVNGRDATRSLPLHYATAHNYLEIVKILLSNGATCYEGDDNDETPLYQACREGYAEAANLLLRMGHSDPNRECGGWWQRSLPLQVAAQNGHEDLVDMLLENGAIVNITDSLSNENCLFSAVRGKSEKIVRRLLAKDVDVHHKNIYGNNALHAAVQNEEISADTVLKMAKLLVEYGVDVDHGNVESRTPLISAACRTIQHKGEELVELLVKNGARIDAVDTSQSTALIKAVQAQNYAIGGRLLTQGCCIDNMNNAMLSSLDLAILWDKPESFGFAIDLVKHGACVDNPGSHGMRPLDLVCSDPSSLGVNALNKNCRLLLIRCLLHAGAPIGDLRKQGSPISFIKLSRNKSLEEIALASCVPTLYCRCMQVIRKRIGVHTRGKSIWKSIDKLPLPKPIRNDLCFKNI